MHVVNCQPKLFLPRSFIANISIKKNGSRVTYEVRKNPNWIKTDLRSESIWFSMRHFKAFFRCMSVKMYTMGSTM